MSKGKYDVRNDGENSPRPNDASYRSCLCAMLIFITICIIIILAGIKWTKDETEWNPKQEFELLEEEFIQKPAKSNERQELFTTSSHTNILTTQHHKTSIFQTIPFSKFFNTNPITEKSRTEKITSPELNHYDKLTTVGINTPTVSRTFNSDTENTEKPFTTRWLSVGFSKILTSTSNYKGTSSEESFNAETTTASQEISAEDVEENTTASTEETRPYESFENTATVVEETQIYENFTWKTNDIDKNEFTTSSNTEIMYSVDESVADITTENYENSVVTENATENFFMNFSNANEILEIEESTTGSDNTTFSIDLADNLLQTTASSNASVMEKNLTVEDSTLKAITTSLFSSKSIESSTVNDKKLSSTTIGYEQISTEKITRSSVIDQSKLVSSKGIKAKSQPVCNTPGCISAASRILILMNHSATACEDFYEFACGGSVGMQVQFADSDNLELLSRQLARIKNTPSKYLKELNNFHDSCMKHENYFDYEKRTEKLRQLTEIVGDFDLVDSGNVDFTNVFAQLILLQSMPLFDVGLDIDKKTSNYILQLTLPHESSLPNGVEHWSALLENQRRCLNEQRHKIYEANLNLEAIYNSVVECQKNYQHYLNILENSVRAQGAFRNLSDNEIMENMKTIRFMIEFDVLNILDTLPSRREILKGISNKEYDLRKISDLQIHYPFLEWKRFFEILTGHKLDSNTLVQVYFNKYFANLFGMLIKVPKSKLKNALLAIYITNLYENLVLPKNINQQEKFCLKLTAQFFRDVVSHNYLSSYSAKLAKEQKDLLQQVFLILKESFKDSLQKSDWLDDFDKKHSIDKVNRLRLVFGEKSDDNYLNKKYENLNLITDDFQGNFIKLLNFSRNNYYSLEGKKFDEEDVFKYFLNPYDKKMLTYYAKEIIAVPYGIFVNIPRKLPDYVSMARVGFHLAKKIGQHFDPIGINYEMTLSDEAKEKYDSMVSKTNVFMSDKRNTIIDSHNVEFQIPVEYSTNQRIAENTAFRLVTETFGNFGKLHLLPWISFTYSREKILFLLVAQEYCKKRDVLEEMMEIYASTTLPPFLLIENIMSNSEMFSSISVFDCPLGSGMNNNDDQKNQFPYVKIDDDYGENIEDIYRNK